MLSYAKSATVRDRLNGFKNGKTQLFNSWEVECSFKLYLQHCSRTVNPHIIVCAAHFTEDYFLILGVAYQLCTKAVSIKWGHSKLQGQSGASDSQPVSTFSYLKNLPLTIQTRALSSAE